MKKYLMTGIAALTLGGMITSCSHDMDQYVGNATENVKKTYENAFVQTFGDPAPSQDWGFGSSSVAGVRGGTRTITVNGDAYDKFPSADDVAANFPTAIPEDAVEVSQLEALYKGTKVQTQYGEATLWDLYAIYLNVITEGFNLKITQAGTTELGGTYQNSGWDATAGKELARPYNVYVDVDGDVTLKRNGATHFNLYILKGNVTLESNYGEQAGLISVAAGATLNDQRNSIAANQGVKIFNRGTVNATNTEKYDIGNFCSIYNEGKFQVSGPLTYSPADANASYFMNLGDDAELTAPNMTLNSTGNFFNSGKVTITNETSVTQQNIYWVNDGYYKTGSLSFSAKNSTFYNYCQLIVTGNAHMYDGEFNLMPNSYTECGTAEMDNFIVNMGGNTGINIKGNVDVKAQGDGTFQGFKNFGTNNYVLIGGKVTVASHKNTLSIQSDITYNIKELEIIKNGNVVTEDYLQSIGDGDYPVLDLKGTEAPKLTVTPKGLGQGCGATWTISGGGEDVIETIRVIAEDLTINDYSKDFDFNDAVFDVKWNKTQNKVSVKVLAAGGELTMYIGGTAAGVDGVRTVNDYFAAANPNAGITAKTMINTAAGQHDQYNTFEYDLDPTWWSGTTIGEIAKSIYIRVMKSGELITLTADQGKAASKIAVGPDYEWCDERQDIDEKFDGRFSEYVQKKGGHSWNTWYK